jgi:aryl-alcohol dehydrogenase-like predicted oxidoreductase
MVYRKFGNCDIVVSTLGFGAGHIGDPAMDEKSVETLLNGVLDTGINLIDTARSYGDSENRIGKFLSHRRKDFILSTKVGYTFNDKPDWSFEATMGTVDESLQRMKTDYLDIVHLHSCDKYFLETGEATAALEKAREQGKIRVIAYSGENDALTCAIDSGKFGSIQCSVNLFDQHGLDDQLIKAADKNMGVIAKRPLGNSVWRYQVRPEGHGHAVYYDRMQKMGLDLHGLTWNELAIRFAAYAPGVSTIIAGTADFDHLKENLRLVEKGPLDQLIVEQVRSAFKIHGREWYGLI